MASPRIIAGSAKGIRLKSVPGSITRPITDRVKEALFNIIGSDIAGATFLDLYAGTGSVGLEALSRGATFSRFTEINSTVIKILNENILSCGFKDKSDVIRINALKYITSNPKTQFDYIFIAPPQYKNIWVQTLNLINLNSHHCTSDCWVITQIDPLEYQDITLDAFIEIDRRRYGNTLLLFLSRIN